MIRPQTTDRTATSTSALRRPNEQSPREVHPEPSEPGEQVSTNRSTEGFVRTLTPASDNRNLPQSWKDAERRYSQDLDDAAGSTNPAERRLLARQRLVRSATNHLYQMAQHPSGFRDPSLRATIANITGAAFQSILGFTVPVALSELLISQTSAEGNEAQDRLMYFAALVLSLIHI